MAFLSSALVSSKDYLLSSLLHFSPRDETNTVGPSFRLGLPGLLTSEELRRKGYKPNNLLHDQRTAFQWVKQHIAGFGGDPDIITVIGESTGAGMVPEKHFEGLRGADQAV